MNAQAAESKMQAAETNGTGELTVAKQDDLVGKVATVAVIGLGVALIEVELIPGLIIGAAAAFLPNLMPKLGESLRPAMKSTVRAGYKFAQKTREAFAEASEQVQDMVAEAKVEQEPTPEPVATETRKRATAHAAKV